MHSASQADRFDRDRDYRKHEPNPEFDQRAAVAALVGYCEGIVAGAVLPDAAELHLRLLIARTLAAFDMPSKAALEVANAPS